MLRFGDFSVDGTRRLLTRRGAAVALNPKTFDLLLALLERRGELIAKDELLERVWPNQTVEEGNLTVHVSALRKALGERPGEHRFIVTVPGRGYRFVAGADLADSAPPAEMATASPKPAATQGRFFVLAAVAVLVVTAAAYWRQTRTAAADSNHVSPAMTARLLTAIGTVSSAVIAPDGKSFAYVDFQDGRESLWLGHLDGAQPTQLRPPEDVDYQSLAFAPRADRLFYTAHGALYEVPLPGGSARQVLAGIAGGFSVSPDAAQVAFVRRRSEAKTSAIVVADLNGSGREREVMSLSGDRSFSSYGPAWSPDGGSFAVGITNSAPARRFALARIGVADGLVKALSSEEWDDIGRIAWAHDGSGIAFNAVGANSDFHIWFLETAAGKLRCLTPDLSRYGRASVSVSDDGRSLLAVRGEINSTVWVAPAGGAAEPRPITSRAFGKLDGSSGLTWMPDGTIVYVSFFNNNYSLWTMRSDGSNAKLLTTAGFVDQFPQASADGRAIVFQSNRGGGSDIWRIDGDGGHMRQLTTGGHASEPALTPDGRWVLYTAPAGDVDAIWKMPIDGGAAVRVTNGSSGWASVSPDGTLIALASGENASGVPRLAVIAFDTGRLVAEFAPARGSRLSGGLRWAADGSAVFYRDFSQGLWRQAIAGGPPQKTSDAPDKRIYVFDWSRDGRQVAMSYGDEVRDVVLMNGFR